MNSRLTSLLLIAFLVISFELTAFACDPCALYNSSRLRDRTSGALTLSLSEQYTNYIKANDLKDNSIRDGEYIKGFSTTQLSLAYDLTEKFTLQATIPYLARRFDEIRRYRAESEGDGGVGDLSLVGSYYILDHKSLDWMVAGGLTAGVKFPTGETGVLREITREDETTSKEGLAFKHHHITSASGGRALTFGTGSFDYIFGADLISRYKRILALSSLQYTVRTEGKFDYQFADDIIMSIGAGYYLYLEHDLTVAGLLVFSGEFKGRDDLSNSLVTGSQVSNLYVGPGILLTISERIGAEVSLDCRVSNEDKNVTIVPETRVRASVSYRF